MNDAALTLRQVGYEQRMFWRNPGAWIFTFVFPIMFLVIFATIFGGGTISYLNGIASIQYYVPGVLVFGVISACYTSLSISLTLRRDAGMLKRKRGTPLPAAALIGGLIGSAVLVAALETIAVLVVGVVAYGLTVHAADMPALALVVAVGATLFCTLGVAVSSLTPNADAAPAITNLVIFPLLFISGTFFPVQSRLLNDVAGVLPVRPFVLAAFAIFDPRRSEGVLRLDQLGLMLLWAVVGSVVAVRFFRWEPHRSG